MANKKITELNAAANIQGSDQMVIVNESETRKATIEDLSAVFGGGGSSTNFKKSYVLGEDLNAGDIVRFEPDNTIKKVFGGEFPSEDPLAGTSSSYTVELDTDTFIYCYQAGPAAGGKSIVGHVVIGQRDGNLVTFGTPVEFGTLNVNIHGMVKLSSSKALIAYNQSGDEYLIVANISGTTVTLGATNAQPAGDLALGLHEAGTDLALYSFHQSGTSDARVAKVTVSGDAATVSAGTVFSTSETSRVKCALVSTDTSLMTYTEGDSNEDLKSVVIDSSGTTPTLGTPITINSGSNTVKTIAIGAVDASTAVVAYTDPDFSFTSAVKVDISGTTATASVSTIISASGHSSIALAVVSSTLAVASFNNTDENGSGTITVTIDIGASSLTIGPVNLVNEGFTNSEYNAIAVSATMFLITYIAKVQVQSRVGHIVGTSICFETRREFIGIMDEAGLTGETKNVILSGIYTSPTTLASGPYQVSPNGQLELQDTSGAPVVGKAVSTTEFLITN